LTFTLSTWYSVGDESGGMSRYFRPEGVLYERVDGCLLLFCLVLVVLAPIFFLFEVLSEVHAVYFGPAADALRVISVVGLCLDGLFVILGMVAGVLLLLKKRGGVYLALIGLGARLPLVVFIGILLCLFNQVANGIPWTYTIHYLLFWVVEVTVGSGIWITYLLTSRRVKYMYFERHEGEDWE
jgi:hypothetical protein